jgi:nitrate/TMAO reductase-like tetraheme cytochrome c subunit
MFPKSTLLLVALLTLVASCVQAGPRDPKNLKVLPPGTSRSTVMKIMKQWNTALGAKCTDCHKSIKMAHKDGNPEKEAARKMATMVKKINELIVAKEGGTKVTCYSCHRGFKKVPDSKANDPAKAGQ